MIMEQIFHLGFIRKIVMPFFFICTILPITALFLVTVFVCKQNVNILGAAT